MLSRILFVLLLSFVTIFTVRAEETDARTVDRFKGVVIDATSGEKITGAMISVKGTIIGCYTNSDGEFEISLRKIDNPTLEISVLGYKPQEITVTNSNDIEVKLEKSLVVIDEVVVTGNRTSTPLKDVPVLTRVVSSEDIKRINPMTFQSLLEYEIPGLQFGRAHGSNLPEITFQGVTGSYLLFLINGERMAGEGSSDNVDFSRINIDDIERVEIVRGAMSTLYGSDAMGGVINIITKDAKRPLSGNISSRINSYGGHKQYLSLEAKQNNLSSYTSASYRTEDAYSVTDVDGGIASMSGYEILNFNQRFSYSITDKLKADIDGAYYQNRQLELAESKAQDVFNSLTINARLNWIIDENNLVKVSFLNDNYTKNIEYKAASTDKIYNDIKNTLRAEYVGFFNDKHTVIAGVELDTENLLHYRLKDSGRYETQNYIVFAQEEWKVNNNLAIVIGVRGDFHSHYGANSSPKLSLMYKAGDLTFRGGYAMGFRLPSLRERYEEYDMGGLGMFTIHGNEDLKIEKSNQFSLSTEYNHRDFNMSISAYYNEFDNKISMRLLNDGTSDQQYFNAEDATTAGVDISAQYRLDMGLTVKGSYSYINSFEELEGYNTSTARPHSANINARYSFALGSIKSDIAINGRWLSSVDAWYQDSTTDNFEMTHYNQRTIFSANIGFRFPRGINFILQVDNLLNYKDEKISSDLTLTPERGISYAATLNINIADLIKLK